MRPDRWTACEPPWSAAARSARSTPRPWPSLPESEFVAVCDVESERAEAFATRFGVQPYADRDQDARWRARSTSFASRRRTRSTPRRPSRRRRPARTSWSRSRWPRASPIATPCSRQRAHHKTKLGVISQRRWYEPVRRMKDAIDAGKIGRPVLGVVHDV